uniref:Uncharacterized protein n=1 Tax=Candidatus Kentrum sp. TUN TaxID=2126343 RepID=A0A451A1L2_9GAMM|nr:MAG: hypothetical protein BECKTUN1418E_GA0071001_10552 [Candidatus Kentron sp. TUN]
MPENCHSNRKRKTTCQRFAPIPKGGFDLTPRMDSVRISIFPIRKYDGWTVLFRPKPVGSQPGELVPYAKTRNKTIRKFHVISSATNNLFISRSALQMSRILSALY